MTKEEYKIIGKNQNLLNTCSSLAEALQWAKTVGVFVTIKGPTFEVCGLFGADSVKNGLCPDGVEYSWKKRRI